MQEPVSSMPPTLEALVRAYAQRQPRCLLCQAPPDKIVALMPEALAPLDLPDRQTGCVFALCADCLEREDKEARILAALRADWREQEAVPWN